MLVEYGELVLDLNLRFRIHALMQWMKEQKIKFGKVKDLLKIKFDSYPQCLIEIGRASCRERV